MSNTLDIFSLMPSDTPSYMFDAWLGCIAWCASESAIVDRFSVETGCKAAVTPLDKIIDEAFDGDDGDQYIERVERDYPDAVEHMRKYFAGAKA